MVKKWWAYLLLIFILIQNCVRVPPPKLPEPNLVCHLMSLNDQTNIYSQVKPKLENLILAKLEEKYAQHLELGPTSGYDKTAYIYNMFRIQVLDLASISEENQN